jgi:hypothetical protein
VFIEVSVKVIGDSGAGLGVSLGVVVELISKICPWFSCL